MHVGYIVNDQAKEAINLFQRTKNPDDILHIIFFNACAQIASKEILPVMENVSKKIRKSFYQNKAMLISMITAFMKCHDVQQAESIFEQTKNPSIEMTNAMMKGYIANNEAKKAIDLFQKAEDPDSILYNLFFSACAQVGSKEIVSMMENIWKKIPEEFHHNKYILASTINAFMRHHLVERAEAIFKQTENPPIDMINAMMKGKIVTLFYIDGFIFSFNSMKVILRTIKPRKRLIWFKKRIILMKFILFYSSKHALRSNLMKFYQ